MYPVDPLNLVKDTPEATLDIPNLSKENTTMQTLWGLVLILKGSVTKGF